MIFRQMNEVRSGAKTQTRRLVKPDEYTWICGEWEGKPAYSSVHAENGRVRFRRGKSYACVPKMYQKSFGRILITGIRRERLQDITEADAVKEGVTSVDEYRELWDSINGKTKGARWTDNPKVYVLQFEYEGDTPN